MIGDAKLHGVNAFVMAAERSRGLHCSFDLHFLDCEIVMINTFICLLGICMSSWRKYSAHLSIFMMELCFSC